VKKKLLAICLGSLFASAASAQTSVVLYGIADGGVRFDHTTNGTLKTVQSGGESGTRWGIRGTEDLGGGLKAVFTFEQGFDLSDNSSQQGNIGGTTPNSPTSSVGSRIFSRTAQVGLSSDKAGDLLFGRAFTPFYVTWNSIDPMAGGLVGGAQNFATGSVTRFDNAAYYNSVKFAGFQVTAAYRLGESNVNNAALGSVKRGGDAGNIALTYAAGPVLVGYSYLSLRNAVDNNTQRVHFIGAAYDLKFVKLDAMYFNNRNQTTTKIQSYAFGATVPIQSFNIFAQVARIDNKGPGNDAQGSLQKNDDATFIGIGAQYNLSKRTDIYTSYAKQINKGNAINVLTDAGTAGLYTTTGATANVLPGFDPWSAQVGISHKF
jgi:predicted porin